MKNQGSDEKKIIHFAGAQQLLRSASQNHVAFDENFSKQALIKKIKLRRIDVQRKIHFSTEFFGKLIS